MSEKANATAVINIGRLRRDRGFSVARPTALGNPFVIGKDGDRAETIAKYSAWLQARLQRSDNPRLNTQFAKLVDAASRAPITLLCWCAPKRCHAEVIRSEILRALDERST